MRREAVRSKAVQAANRFRTMANSFDEFDLINRIRRASRPHPRVPLGIGDDAAVIDATSARNGLLVATDMLMDGRHFHAQETTPRDIGRKALAVNLSDIAAMAGQPTAAFVSIAHNRALGIAFADAVHLGLAELAAEFNVAIAGGDTNVWDGPLVVNLTLLGETGPHGPITRRGAQPGDQLFVTGPLGGSLASGRHLRCQPRIREAQQLADGVKIHAMLDISDGLLGDLAHIQQESNVGIELFADHIPIHPDVPVHRSEHERLMNALTDGEDFELAFCVSPADAAILREQPVPNLVLSEIGRIVGGNAITVLNRDQQPIPINEQGWRHRW